MQSRHLIWRSALERLQLFFELPVSKLQFFVLTGQRPQLIFQPINTDLRIEIARLRECACGKAQRHNRERGAENGMKSE